MPLPPLPEFNPTWTDDIQRAWFRAWAHAAAVPLEPGVIGELLITGWINVLPEPGCVQPQVYLTREDAELDAHPRATPTHVNLIKVK